jgi:hypothetical protein
MAESLRVVPVLVVEVAVSVHEPHHRYGTGRCDWNLRPEWVVDALRVDIRVVPAMAERNDAEAAVGLYDQAAFNPLDGIRVWCANGDALVEVVTMAGVLFLGSIDVVVQDGSLRRMDAELARRRGIQVGHSLNMIAELPHYTHDPDVPAALRAAALDAFFVHLRLLIEFLITKPRKDRPPVIS